MDGRSQVKRALVLEDFDGRGPGPGSPEAFSRSAAPDQVFDDPASLRVDAGGAGYEQGYSAGWDDCERETQAARQAIAADFSRNLQDLNFTYHEARAHITSALVPLLRTFVTSIVPRLAEATLGVAIAEELQTMAEIAVDAPITVIVAPAQHSAVEEFLGNTSSPPFRLVAEPALGVGQVCFRLGQHERQLDLDEMQRRILERIDAFAEQNEKVLKHG